MEVSGFPAARDLVLGECRQALEAVDPRQVDAVVEAFCGAGRVFVVGVGRVFLVLQAFARRLNHLGIPAVPVGAIDEPPITVRDLLVAGSGSGESLVPAAIAQKAKSLGAKVLYLGSISASTVAGFADLAVRIPCRTRLARADEIPSLQPMTTLFEQSLLLLCDALCLLVMKRRGIDPAAAAQAHANLE